MLPSAVAQDLLALLGSLASVSRTASSLFLAATEHQPFMQSKVSTGRTYGLGNRQSYPNTPVSDDVSLIWSREQTRWIELCRRH